MSGYIRSKDPYIAEMMRQVAEAKNKANHICHKCRNSFKGEVYWVCKKNSAYLLHVCKQCAVKYER
jgi:hypothetical protein